jgi:hypothetical protein
VNVNREEEEEEEENVNEKSQEKTIGWKRRRGSRRRRLTRAFFRELGSNGRDAVGIDFKDSVGGNIRRVACEVLNQVVDPEECLVGETHPKEREREEIGMGEGDEEEEAVKGNKKRKDRRRRTPTYSCRGEGWQKREYTHIVQAKLQRY